MEENNTLQSSRRNFIGTLAKSTAALSMATIAAPLIAEAGKPSEISKNTDDPELWFKKLKGKHRIVFDATGPHEIFPFAWARVFLMTNEGTGTPESEANVVVILRHNAIPFALNDNLWSKYKLGEFFKIEDGLTKAPAEKNPFSKPNPGDYKIPGIGNVAIGIDELQKSGVMFCACNVALTVYSNVAAQKMNMSPDDVKKEWTAGVLPGVQLMPSGVWAVGRAQEHGCSYCFVG